MVLNSQSNLKYGIGFQGTDLENKKVSTYKKITVIIYLMF